jgi:hypothetical protein
MASASDAQAYGYGRQCYNTIDFGGGFTMRVAVDCPRPAPVYKHPPKHAYYAPPVYQKPHYHAHAPRHAMHKPAPPMKGHPHKRH